MHCHNRTVIKVLLSATALVAVSTFPLPLTTIRACQAEPAAPAAPAKDSAPAAPAGQAPAPDATAAAAKEIADRTERVLNTRTAVGPIKDTTAVEGKIPVDLTGVWLVVANTKPSPQHAPEAFQSFVQLVKVTDGATPKAAFHMLDVQMPGPIQADIDKAMGNLVAWQPSPEQLATLKKTWSTLPAFKDKNLNQPIYLTIDYKLVTPDHYQEALKITDPQLLDGSTFALSVSERYRPGNVPKDSGINIAQLMGRDSIYSFKAAEGRPDQLSGGAVVKFTAAGAGFPLPMSFGGRVQMYKLGS